MTAVFATRAVVQLEAGPEARSVSYSSDGAWVAIERGERVEIREARGGELIAGAAMPREGSATFAGRALLIAAGSTVGLWSLEGGVVANLALQGPVRAVSVARSGRRALVLSLLGGQGTSRVFELAIERGSLSVARSIALAGQHYYGGSFAGDSAEEDQLVLLEGFEGLVVRSGPSFERAEPLARAMNCWSIAVHPRVVAIEAHGFAGNHLEVIAREPRQAWSFHGGYPATPSPDGELLAIPVHGRDGSAGPRLFRASTGAPLSDEPLVSVAGDTGARPWGNVTPCARVAFSPSGDELAVVTMHHQLHLLAK